MSESSLERLNALPEEHARVELLKCCGSTAWADRLIEQRPIGSVAKLKESAREIWASLDIKDWREAFHAHPKIGEKKAVKDTGKVAQAWSEGEQSGTQTATDETLAELARLNQEYEKKFGFIFIVCATGKSSEEMLRLLRERLGNSEDQELHNAAAEQAKITELRIDKLLDL
jgi:OHCU decarboxylase